MRIPMIMMAVFSALLASLYASDLVFVMGTWESARLLVVGTIAAGLIPTLAAQRPRWRRDDAASHRGRTRAKCWSLVAGLLAILAYAQTMTAFGVQPFGAFVADYALALPALLLLVPVYVRWADARLQDPEDGYFAFGECLIRRRSFRWAEQRAFLLAWLVKIAFVPFMYGALVMAAEQLVSTHLQLTPARVIGWLFMFGLVFDLIIGTSGYLFASKLLGNEVRSTDSTWSGWLVCMVCYPPLLGWFQLVYRQSDKVIWDNWLTPGEPLYWVWAALVTGTWLIYWLSTASFGLRFSNLSWRGLVSIGPYRWTKHPAYLSKNIYWWLHTVPFVGVDGWGDLARNVLGLCCLSLVYYLRAKTEERHLMRFPEYAAYARWIEREGLLVRIRATMGLNSCDAVRPESSGLGGASDVSHCHSER